MTFEELQEVTQEPLVPSHLLIESLMMRIALKEAPEKFQPTAFRLQKRPAMGRVFEYTSDFDDKGVLYYIGKYKVFM